MMDNCDRSETDRRLFVAEGETAAGGTGESPETLCFCPDTSGQRTDLFLLSRLTELTRAQLKHWFNEGRVSAAGQLLKGGEKTRSGRVILVRPPAASTDAPLPRPQAMALDIRYEDPYLLVLNKPQGLVVHPAAGHVHDTLVSGLLYHYGEGLSDVQGAFRPGIVHRIDKDTSGLLLIVKDAQVHAKLAGALSRHEIRRRYLALVYGCPQASEGTIDLPIARSPHERQKMAVRADGRRAVTHFRLLERLRGMALLELELETGRTHQIRVHLRHIGHPVLADPVYAPKRERYGLKGQALHAFALDFVHPVSGLAIHVEAEPPDYFAELIKKYR